MYNIKSPYFTLRDKAVRHSTSKDDLARQFDDYYHLFLMKVARMPQDKALTHKEEERLITLFSKLNTLKRKLDTR